jgi:hypothetical protein
MLRVPVVIARVKKSDASGFSAAVVRCFGNQGLGGKHKQTKLSGVLATAIGMAVPLVRLPLLAVCSPRVLASPSSFAKTATSKRI